MAAKKSTARVCKIEGCSGKVIGWGWCRKHYFRWQRTGDPLGRRGAANGELLTFLRKLSKDPPDTCVLWPFNKDGVCPHKGKNRRAARVSLAIYTGRDPKKLYARHGPCHNPLCVNPHHLSWGTPSENCADKHRDGTHREGTVLHNAKLTPADVRKIRKDPRSQTQIALDYGVTQTAISAVCRRITWKHVK